MPNGEGSGVICWCCWNILLRDVIHAAWPKAEPSEFRDRQKQEQSYVPAERMERDEDYQQTSKEGGVENGSWSPELVCSKKVCIEKKNSIIAGSSSESQNRPHK